MIAQETEKLRETLTRLAEVKRDKQKADDLEPLRKELDQARAKLVAMAAQFSVLYQRGLVAGPSSRSLSALPPRTAQIKEKFVAAPESLKKGATFPGLIKSIELAADDLRDAATVAWRDCLRKVRPKADRQELARYQNSTQWRATVELVQRLVAQADAVDVPASKADFDQAMDLFERLRQALAKLPKPQDDDVRRFMDAAGTERGAELEQLTPRVLEWLESQNLGKAYGIWPR